MNRLKHVLYFVEGFAVGFLHILFIVIVRCELCVYAKASKYCGLPPYKLLYQECSCPYSIDNPTPIRISLFMALTMIALYLGFTVFKWIYKKVRT